MDPESDLQSLLSSVKSALAGNAGETALETLERGTEAMKVAFQQDPGMAVTGELFRTADQLGESALEMARHFLKTGELELEERALRVRYETMATAHTYSRHLVGPALLDWADCRMRLGQSEEAEALFYSVVKDFSRLLGWGPTFDPDWLVAVQCLQRAMNCSSRDFSELQRRTDEVLRQSEELVEARAAQQKSPVL